MSSNIHDLFMDYGPKPGSYPRVELPMLGDGSHAFIRPLSGKGHQRWSHSLGANDGLATSILIQDCLCHEDGTRIFLESDIPKLSNKPAEVLSVMEKAISDHEGLFKTEEQVEQDAKNSEDSQ